MNHGERNNTEYTLN